MQEYSTIVIGFQCVHTQQNCPVSLPCLRHAQGWQNISRQAIWIDDWYLAKNLHCGSSFPQYASRKAEPVPNPSPTSFSTCGCSWLSLLHYESISQQVWGRGRKSGGKSKRCTMSFCLWKDDGKPPWVRNYNCVLLCSPDTRMMAV